MLRCPAPQGKNVFAWKTAQKKQNRNILLFVTSVFSKVNRILNTKSALEKAISVGGSKNTEESGSGIPSHQRPMGVRGRCSRRSDGDFTAFTKKYAFLGIFWSIFLLKNALLNGWIKWLMRPPVAPRPPCYALLTASRLTLRLKRWCKDWPANCTKLNCKAAFTTLLRN